MRILFVAAEALPYVKVGGLGDVAGALPKALAILGHDVRLVLPRYAGVQLAAPEVAWSDTIELGGERVEARGLADVMPGSSPPVAVRLIECDRYFGRERVYGEDDDGDRFAVLAYAALRGCVLEQWQPDILHVHDWHSALAAILLAGVPDRETRSVLTIHNLAFQGHQPASFAARHGLPAPPQVGDTDPDHVNLLGRGIAIADAVTTVSPTYALEITGPEAGSGLDPVLRARGDVIGIVNGIDTDRFDPAADPFISTPFNAGDPDQRLQNRAALLAELGLGDERDGPLLGVVSRLFDQKGLDLVLEAGEQLLARGARLVVLGAGDADLERGLRDLAAVHSRSAAVVIGFDVGLAQRIYAGSDLFLMPSRFEPCGLGQLIAMRYGSIPLGRRTGGLADTIVPYARDRGTGFLFDEPTAAALVACFDEALAVFHEPPAWQALVARALAADHSWSASARAFDALYRRLVAA